MPDRPEIEETLKRAVEAYEDAWTQVRAHGDEALEALKKAGLFQPGSSGKELFKLKAERAITAAASWQRAANLCLKTIAEARVLL